MARRIHIIGSTGSGKTYIAGLLSRRLDMPAFDLDDLFWDRSASTYGVRAAADVRDRRLAEIVAGDAWIVEGVYHQWAGPSFDRADVIVALAPSVWVRDAAGDSAVRQAETGAGPVQAGVAARPVGIDSLEPRVRPRQLPTGDDVHPRAELRGRRMQIAAGRVAGGGRSHITRQCSGPAAGRYDVFASRSCGRPLIGLTLSLGPYREVHMSLHCQRRLMTVLVSLLCLHCTAAAVSAQSKTVFKELAPGETHRLDMSMDDTFIIRGSETWSIAIGKELPLRFGEVSIVPRQGDEFKLNLRFLCDTSDLAKLDTPAKMKASLNKYIEQFLADSVEKKADPVRMDVQGRFGFQMILTDAKFADGKNPPAGEFKYMIPGMLRLTDDSAIMFVLMCNDPQGKPRTEAMDYITGFVKPVRAATTKP